MILGRLLSATPSTDGEHWDLQFRWHSDIWHTDAYGQDPRKWQRNPGARPPNRVPYPWEPARSSWLTDDAIFPGKQTIGIYTGPGQITIAGMPPIAQISKLTAAPQVPLQATVATGGTIAAGTNYIGLVSLDSDGRKSQCSLLIKAVGAGGSLKYTIPNIVFDSKAVSYEAYMGPTPLEMWRVQTGAPSSSITLGTSTLPASGMGRPDICFSKFRIRITSIRHGGIWGTGAFAIGANSITLPHTPTLNQWAGRIISLYGSATRVGGTGPFSTLCYAKPANFSVTGNDTAGVMTVLQSTLISGTPFTFPGDAYVMRARASIASATTIGDPDFVNQFAPNGLGAVGTNYEAGKVVWIFDGKGAGQFRNIGSNTSDTLTITSAWDIVPDSTSHFMVLEPNPIVVESDIFNTDGLSLTDAILGAITVPFSTQGSQSFLVQVITEDAAGNISPKYKAPWQEVFVPAQQSSSLPDGLFPITVSGGNATIDLANGLNQELTLDGTSITVLAPIFTGGVIAEGSWFTLYLRQLAPGNHDLPTFTNAAGAFSSNVARVIVYSPDAGTDSPVTFTFRGGYWIPDASGALPT